MVNLQIPIEKIFEQLGRLHAENAHLREQLIAALEPKKAEPAPQAPSPASNG